MRTIRFTKVVGTGNDFIIVDTLRQQLSLLRRQWPTISRTWCDRRNGIGADGILLLEPSKTADVRMRVFNPDGSEAEMCGNGARCVALYVSQEHRGTRSKAVTLETLAGRLFAQVRGNRVAMCMTDPTDLCPDLALEVDRRSLRMGVVNTGVPHAVVPVTSVEAADVTQLGRALRQHPYFAPDGTNVNFLEEDTKHPNRIRIRTYERGVEDETLACGTGVAAAAILHALRCDASMSNGVAHQYRVQVQVKSGDLLTVSFVMKASGVNPRVTQVVLEGSAHRVFDGAAKWPMRRGT